MSDDDAHEALRGRDLIGLGGLLAAGVIAGTLIGLLLDNAFGTTPVCTLLGILVGTVGAAVGCWLKVRDALRG
jgi:F0F1-type ATP synthase assembly protein I